MSIRFYASDMNCRAREALVLNINLREADRAKAICALSTSRRSALLTGQVVGAEASYSLAMPGPRACRSKRIPGHKRKENGLIISN